LQLIRIIQEALINVRKHAHAQQVRISCREIDHVLIIEIQDDGQGFFANEVLESSQYGMRGMRERAKPDWGRAALDKPAWLRNNRTSFLPLRDEWEENIE